MPAQTVMESEGAMKIVAHAVQGAGDARQESVTTG
jgi:hypothetical protein